MINDSTGRMATELPLSNETRNGVAQSGSSDATFTVKSGLARMLQGGVIMDVVNAEQVRCPVEKFFIRHLRLTRSRPGTDCGGSRRSSSNGP